MIALPPLLYLAALVLGLLLQWLAPFTLALPVAARWAGAVLVVAGIAFAVAARREFTRAGTNINPMQPTTAIVTSGPFRLTRNPMYVAMVTAWVGLAVATRNGWFLVLLPVLVALIHWGVVVREERYLERKFGATYQAYRRRVRRYV